MIRCKWFGAERRPRQMGLAARLGWRWGWVLIPLMQGLGHAEVYKCVDAHKSITFSELPCAKDQAMQIVTPKVSNDALALSDLKLVYYDVVAPDFKSALSVMEKVGPQGFQGMASWRISYTYGVKQMPRYCVIDSVVTREEGRILMPKWQNIYVASPSDQARWTRLQIHLKHHEDGHIAHGLQLADAVRNRLQALQMPDCADLKPLAQKHFDRLLQIYRQKDIDYDRETDHGRRQWLSIN